MNDQQETYKNIDESIKNARKEIGTFNIIIAGRTGVGKSTLINSVFQGTVATTGHGKPVTKQIRKIEKKDIPLSIYDTRGLELEKYNKNFEEIEELVKQCAQKNDPNEHIHAAWLCIHEDGRRVEDAEIKLHEMLAKHMPVIAVITKSRSDQGFRSEVQKQLLQTKNVMRVRAISEKFDEGPVLPSMGLGELIDVTSEVIPEGFQGALAAAQKASIEHKKTQARRIVAQFAASAGGAGASPIPFSDVVALAPLQIGMLTRLSNIFGLPLTTSFLSTIVASAAGVTGASFAGRAIATNLIKLFPGAGSLVGGTIAAGTAVTLTGLLGEAYTQALCQVISESDQPRPEDIAQEFRGQLKKG